MAGQVSASTGAELHEQLALLSTTSAEAEEENDTSQSSTGNYIGILDLSDEVLLLILRKLDPTSLLRLGATCCTLFRVCSCNSLWTKHFQGSFEVSLAAPAACSVPAKEYFRLVFMWKTLFKNLHCNRFLQEKLFANVPYPPHQYWTQWLVLEESVPLPVVRLPTEDIQAIWGIGCEALKQVEVKEEDNDMKFEWCKLHGLACEEHGDVSKVFHYVLKQQEKKDHEDLEAMFHQYTGHRFQWHFSYWLFKQPPPFNRQLHAIFLQWRKHNKRKVSKWAAPKCDVEYLASLHPITADYWKGRLALGDETAGIQVIENYFSMCKSLVAWILGRDWGRLKRRKVYEDTLDGVYLVLRREAWEGPVDHQRFWEVAKSQMSRVCTLEETAANYVNWKMIENLPYYKLYMVTGNAVYLGHLQNFLQRKQLVHSWINLEDNAWVRNLLPEDLFTVLEYHSKISQDCLHGDGDLAQLSRLVWLYLNSGQLLYLEAIKGLVLQHAQGCLSYFDELCPLESMNNLIVP
ncbi:uncharacterized protein si:dkeyp-114g9.1 [Gadus macrocephalus]|uniref:uncharacterized protein si:dkeyp-114g9.1 n=1 Tax=Gadus macrocephalus TaxID=80720 RepID=UPI0028CBBB57|nr:uncharacterized protein si:dkeyp-114g9.1 [Gadus macrocephalus]